ALHGPLRQPRGRRPPHRPDRGQRHVEQQPDVLLGEGLQRPVARVARHPHAKRGAAMKKRTVAFSLAALAALAGVSVALTDSQIYALTQIDAVPSRGDLTALFNNNDQQAFSNLQGLAGGEDATPDGIAVRIRAIHALAKYCPLSGGTPCPETDPAHMTLKN